MFRALFKLWPALTPIALYLLWYFLFKRKRKKSDIIEGDFEVVGEQKKKNDENYFSLANKKFATVIYLTFVMIIVSLVFLAFSKDPVKYPLDSKTIQDK